MIWFFEEVNLFKLLCPHKFEMYRNAHAFNTYGKNDYIYFEDDAATKIYLIDHGKVKIGYYTEEGEEIVKAILKKGELFGEKAVLGIDRREEFAQSVDKNTSICPVSMETMQELIRDNTVFSLRFYKFLGHRFRKLERRLQLLLFKDVKTRLLEFFEELEEDYGDPCPETGETVIRHPYTQKDLASLLGTSRPTLNSIMNELKESGLIDFNRREIRLLKTKV